MKAGPEIVTLALVAGLWCGACGDPERERRVDALGPESPEVPVGPLHRPGQPCLACHDGSAATTRYSVAGTVYLYADDETPAPHVNVELTDDAGRTLSATTNCAGNFFVTPSELAPTFPLWLSVAYGDDPGADGGAVAPGARSRIDMQSRIGRDGSCGSCHAPTPSRSTTDRVYLYTTPVDPDEIPRCP